MINNDLSNQLNRYFNRPSQAGAGGTAQELYQKIKAKRDALNGKAQAAEDEAAAQAETDKAATKNAKAGNIGKGFIHTKTKSDGSENKKSAATTAKTDDVEANLTPEEKRQKEIQAILDKLNAEEAAKYPSRANKETAKTEEASDIITTENTDDLKGKEGFMSFLNDMPLFNEFKTGLMDAFKRLDSAAAGSISAQYELNYSSMQYIADAAGNYEYKETSFNIKLDLNYIKAAAGGQTGKSIADIIGGSDDFESLVNNLKGLGQNQQTQKKTATPNDIMAGLQDYFSPEKTADRILDFSTAFFPNSAAFKTHGDTEEGREEFAKMMRDAIQKGFDQAMGKLGAVPKKTQEGIDKTHELVFNGIDDFVKNGMNRNKQDQGIYSALEQFAMSFEMSYSEKTVSVRNSAGSTYGSQGETQNNNQQTQSTLDTQA